MAARSSWLLLLLVACGRTDHNGRHAATSGGTASTGGSVGTKLSPDEVGGAAGSAPEPSCLYPIKGLEPSSPVEGGPRMLDVSPPFPIDVAPATWGELSATLDLNGDLVSDLIYLDREAAEASPSSRFRLAMTAPPPNVFEFWEQDCDALRALPAGRLLLRDLDGDAVPDFVVGTTYGLKAFLNHEAGLEPVMDFSYPSPATQTAVVNRAALLNVGAADFNGDGRVDLVAGVDRVEGGGGMYLGVQSFLQQADGHFNANIAYWGRFDVGEGLIGDPYMGYLAAGRFGSDDRGSAVLITARKESDTLVVEQTSFDGAPPTPLVLLDVQESIQHVFALPKGNGHDALLAIGENNFYVIDLSRTPPVVSPKLALHSPSGITHDLGGGNESPRYFLYDYDRDGDVDFFESSVIDQQLVVYTQNPNSSFDPPLSLPLRVRSGAEDPFLMVGPGSGIVAHPTDEYESAAVYTLMGFGSAPPK